MYDDETLKKLAKETAKETIKEMSAINKWHGKKMIGKTVELLESIIDLKDKIEQDKADIEDLKKERFSEVDFHRIKPREGPPLDDETRHLQKIRNRERAMLRTSELLKRVETALSKMKNEDGYEILEMRYLRGMSTEQIAEELHYTKMTINRKRNKLIQKLGRKLHGVDAMDV